MEGNTNAIIVTVR